MELLESTVLSDVLNFLDARSLGRMRMSGLGGLVERYVEEVAVDRRVQRGGGDVPLVLDLMLRQENAVLWELFADESWRDRWSFGAPPDDGPNPWAALERRSREPPSYDFVGIVDDDDDEEEAPRDLGLGGGCLALRGGGEMNFTGLRRPLPADGIRPRRIAFRYRIPRRARRRGYCNIFLSKNAAPFRSAGVFYAGGPDVFSFLLPLGSNDQAELWLPSMDTGAINRFGPDTADGRWHFIEAHLNWATHDDEGHATTILTYKVSVDGTVVQPTSATQLHSDCDALRHIYIFNWISGRDLHHDDDDDDDDDDDSAPNVPEAQLADLIIEDHIPHGPVSDPNDALIGDEPHFPNFLLLNPQMPDLVDDDENTEDDDDDDEIPEV